MLTTILLPIVTLIGIGGGYFFRKYIAEQKIQNAEEKAKFILDKASKEASDRRRGVELEGKNLLFRLRQDFENETKQRRLELTDLEKRFIQKEVNLDRRLELLEKKEKEFESRAAGILRQEEGLKVKEGKLAGLIAEEKERLQKISSLSPDEAKQILLARLSEELNSEKAVLIKKQEEELRLQANKSACEIISSAIRKYAAEYVAETTVSVVNLPSDEMKGRVIGREGRNIRAFEMATGVDVIIDDTPESVILSSFDPIRREIARASLEKLISDGRIHPARIEEIVLKARKDLEEQIQQKGEAACFELGVEGLRPELIRLLGRLSFRTSFGQNALQHSIEVAYFLGAMASELGADWHLARRIGLLHDIGKAVDQQQEGTHARIGASLVKKYGEPSEVIHAIESHHEEQTPVTLYAILAVAADAISAARPGARKETLEAYIKRLEKLEAIANLFKGVEKSYAVAAGREIRVIVEPQRISDSEAINLARDIKKRVEEGLEYPGQIKVTVIREVRAIEYAK